MKLNLTLAAIFLFTMATYSQTNEIFHLWPNEVPGESLPKNPSKMDNDPRDKVLRVTEVTDPTLTVFEPKPSNKNGAGIIICPGGGYQILALDKEGYEIAQWLNQLGFTAFVLEYRVPEKREGALMDVQRAIRSVRSQADKWNLAPDKIGVMGFSAGGSLSARASTNFDKKTYERVDGLDEVSCRPDYTLLIYPAYLDQGENRSLTPELKIEKSTPPMFIFATADDPYANSALVMATTLRDAQVPVELHLLPYGGHGYGLRKGSEAAETWPLLAEKWLNAVVSGNLKP